MLPTPADYQVWHGFEHGRRISLPPGKSYMYLMAGNGLWKFAESRHLQALIPLARYTVAGLPTLRPVVRFRHVTKLSGSVFWPILVDARREAREQPREAMYHFALRARRVEVTKPEQDTSAGNVRYKGGDDPDIILDLHSHHEMSAYFSSTDNRDEQGFRLYGVFGTIWSRPTLRLRIGVYGDFYHVDPGEIFTHIHPFRSGGDHAD